MDLPTARICKVCGSRMKREERTVSFNPIVEKIVWLCDCGYSEELDTTGTW